MIERHPIISIDMQIAILGAERLRKKIPINDSYWQKYSWQTPSDRILKKELRANLRELLSSHPFLSTSRAVLYYPRLQHLEIATGIWKQHQDLYRLAERHIKAKVSSPPELYRSRSVIVSGTYFDLKDNKYLKLDVELGHGRYTENDIRHLASLGFIVLDPNFLRYCFVDS